MAPSSRRAAHPATAGFVRRPTSGVGLWHKRGVQGRRRRLAGPPRVLELAARPERLRFPAPVDNRLAAPLTPAAHEREAVVQRSRAALARPSTGTYTVQPGDALWPIAERHLARSSSAVEIAQQVQDLESLNRDRIASGDPDLLEAGEELRLP